MNSISGFLKINLRDAAQAFVMTVITAALASLYKVVDTNGTITTADLKAAALIGLGAGIAHIARKFFSGAPKELVVDTSKTTVIDKATKEVITEAPAKQVTPSGENTA